MDGLLDMLGLASLGRREWTLLGTSTCVVLTVLLTLQLLAQHFRNWTNPKEQKAIVLIALMAPFYGIVSLVGLIEIRGSTAFFSFLEALKECYEALVFEVYTGLPSTIVTVVLNVSVSLALYALVLFYHAFSKELAPHSPLAKFMCVKGIVFFSFWQGVVLEILVAVGFIKSHHIWLEVDQIEEAIQNLLICVEMVIFACAQQYAYSATPYSAKVKKVRKKED